MTITERQDATQLQHSQAEGKSTTHTCNWTYYINPLHLFSEATGTNRERHMCFRHAKEDASKGLPVSKYCQRHNPSCLLQNAATPISSRVLTKYEVLGNIIPQDLHPQLRSTKGPPLLMDDLAIFRWDGDTRVQDREVAMPQINSQVIEGKPAQFSCSPSKFGQIIRELIASMNPAEDP